MENKLFTEIHDSYLKTIPLKQEGNFKHYYFVNCDSKFDVEIIYELGSHTNTEVFVIVVGTNQAVNNLVFKSVSHQPQNKFKINVYGIGLDKSKMKISVYSTVEKVLDNIVLQSINGLILSPTANITGEPILEIHTDSVMAKHALNIGSINIDELFYLQSKGIDEHTAKKLLMLAAIENILVNTDDDYREKITTFINERLSF